MIVALLSTAAPPISLRVGNPAPLLHSSTGHWLRRLLSGPGRSINAEQWFLIAAAGKRHRCLEKIAYNIGFTSPRRNHYLSLGDCGLSSSTSNYKRAVIRCAWVMSFNKQTPCVLPRQMPLSLSRLARELGVGPGDRSRFERLGSAQEIRQSARHIHVAAIGTKGKRRMEPCEY